MNAIQASVNFVTRMLSEKIRYLTGEEIDTGSYEELLSALAEIELSSLTDDSSKKAFWLNCYNGMTSHKIITRQVTHSVLRHPGFFRKRTLNIGGILWSLNDIEHGILRKNRRSLGALSHQFSSSDMRNPYMVETFDHRVHFAMNCGGLSCPIIRIYSEEHIDYELEISERSFILQGFLKDPLTHMISASKIFKWYKKDFNYLYISEEERVSYHLTYQKYDWRVI